MTARSCPVGQLLAQDAGGPKDQDQDQHPEHDRLAPAALAGAAGVVQGLYFGITVFNIGFQAGLKAFTAAVLGGIGNTTGAALGGFVIGFLEVISSVWGQGRWSEAVVFGVLVLVLVFRPTGILGQQLADRA